ncbi:hypothetical protein ES5_04473 [Dietzia cinnamea P4]|nr:hypothetical protein ES5_04473 [Dietzia cinnamea P4]OAH43610.1 hypothetical protein AYJ66_05095 [Dietzia cinnamea]
MNAPAHHLPGAINGRTTRSVGSDATTARDAETPCPFAERFGRRMPRGFAEEAAGMDWRALVDTYAPSSDHFHLADFSRRPLGRGITAYEAILATRTADDAPGDFRAHRLTTESCGDLTAMSEMLSRVGAPAEIERFHQYEGRGFDEATSSWCTILRATSGRRETWALGFGQTAAEASISALLSAATRLHLR